MEAIIDNKKRADNQYPILDVIKNRWSPRAFKDEQPKDEEMMSLFEAARWSASSMNEQPWHFIYARKGSSAHEKIQESLMEGNRKWAKDAPVLMLTVLRTFFVKNGSENKSAEHDLGLAMGNLSMQATQHGIGLHQMGGFDAKVAGELFDLPKGYKAFTAIALGYFGDPDQLDEPFKSRELAERKRYKLKEFVFEGEFRINK